MELAKVLAQLREELANLDAAILSLERLQTGGRRRGRPPGWMSDGKGGNRTPPGKPTNSSPGKKSE